ncbi:MAG: hypothetical protein A3F46_02625 [Legionellales bacterium RIFCSPHIGHO2_12_FULL_42_9]|nr:MAG: hypothetical protein A3F46_02625 [Legionellales bacterium RIFCSPHIGHO2_12_FULL_42_9]
MHVAKRILYYYPIIHTQADLGSLGDVAHQVIQKKVGNHLMAERARRIDAVWKVIRKSVNTLPIDYSKARIYQDGLPICNYTDKIVLDLANQGSVNHQIIFELQQKGGMLLGTEAPDLLLEELELMKKKLNIYSNKQNFNDLEHQLLSKRDHYIAQRINSTLSDAEIGILFLGSLHTVVDKLDMDIEVIYPIGKPKIITWS